MQPTNFGNGQENASPSDPNASEAGSLKTSTALEIPDNGIPIVGNMEDEKDSKLKDVEDGEAEADTVKFHRFDLVMVLEGKHSGRRGMVVSTSRARVKVAFKWDENNEPMLEPGTVRFPDLDPKILENLGRNG